MSRMRRLVRRASSNWPARWRTECTNAAAGGSIGSNRNWSQFPCAIYACGTSPKRIAAHLMAVGRLQAGDVLVEDDFNEERGICEYTVITHDNLTPGIFSKIAGVMTSQGLQILDAQIITRQDGVVVDTFQVSDPDHAGVPPVERRASVAETIISCVERARRGGRAVDEPETPAFPPVAGCPPPARRPRCRSITRSCDRSTIIDVFADDTQGLLYRHHPVVSLDLDLSVHAAQDFACRRSSIRWLM